MDNKMYFMLALLLISLFANGFLLSKSTTLERQINSGAAANLNVPQPGQVAGAEAPSDPTYKLDTVKPAQDSDRIKGDKNAELVFIEYSDYECPFCKRFHPVMQQIMEDYKGKAAWVWRQYPLPFHQNAEMEAQVAECVGDIGGNDKFWKFTDVVFEKTQANGTSFTKDETIALGAGTGVDKNKLTECVNSNKFAQKIKDDTQEGINAGINGTPGTVIIAKNGKRAIIPGALPIDQVKQIIDSLN